MGKSNFQPPNGSNYSIVMDIYKHINALFDMLSNVQNVKETTAKVGTVRSVPGTKKGDQNLEVKTKEGFAEVAVTLK
jgi:hypothetical protein